jgi:hypothetical protein
MDLYESEIKINNNMLHNHGIISDLFNVMIKAEGKRYPPLQNGVWWQNVP